MYFHTGIKFLITSYIPLTTALHPKTHIKPVLLFKTAKPSIAIFELLVPFQQYSDDYIFKYNSLCYSLLFIADPLIVLGCTPPTHTDTYKHIHMYGLNRYPIFPISLSHPELVLSVFFQFCNVICVCSVMLSFSNFNL